MRKLMDKQAIRSMVEWEYTAGQSFSVGDDDVLMWLLDHGWQVTPPDGFVPTHFNAFPENRYCEAEAEEI